MADKSFGVEQVDIFGTGTPTIQSPNDLNLNAVNVAISTNVIVGAGLTVVGVSTFNGNVNINGSITNDLNPDLQDYYDLGGSGIKWKNLFLSRTLHAGDINVTGGPAASGIITATSFSGNGSNLTNLTSANLSGALPAISGASLTNLPASTPTTSDIQVTYEITNQTSFSYYRFAGNGVDSSANNPELLLERGQKYRFINNSGGSHPFQIQTTGGSAYNTGVTNNNASSGNIDFAVRWDAPSILKYQCTNHGSMQGNIYIIGGSRGILTSASTLSGSSNSFNGIPSWATKITVVFYQMSTDTTSARALVRLRNSNGTISSGYDSYSVDEDGSDSADDIQNSTGFVIETQSSGHTYNGTMIIEKIDNTKYVSSYSAVRTATGALGTYQQISGNGRLLIASGGIVTGVSLDTSTGSYDSTPSTNYATIYYE